MRKLLLAFISLCIYSVASNAQNTVQFKDTVIRINDSIAELQIHAVIPKGTELFTTKKIGGDSSFISSFRPDTSLARYIGASDTITETGTLQRAQDTSLQATLHYYTDEVTFKIPLHVSASEDVTVKGSFSWLAKNGDDFPSGENTVLLSLKKTEIKAASNEKGTTSIPLLKIFWIGLGVGLLAVFTPCVFPLIPVTVSFFLKRSKTKADGIKQALTYSISIILIYTVPTFVLTKIFGDTVMYTIATSAVSNLIFCAIFIVFAISFFGAFELTLPSSWATKADQKASSGGLIGIFFMALTLVIVSFSCTGAFVGTLLPQVSSANSAEAGLSAVMGILGLSVGLAIPFSLFAFFPSLLHALPKSGGWLNSVKVVFGFVELAMAMKFLSMVDLIYGWHLLDREVFLAIWIVLSLLTGVYLLGKIKFSHDSDVKFISVPRLFFALAFLIFGVYLIPGMWGAPLKSLSGILPPPSTQDFDLNQLQYKIENIPASGISAATQGADAAKAQPPKLYTNKIHDHPLGLTTYYDLDEGMAAANVLHKPVMLDFTGHSCTNCRKMENEVWSDPEVLKRLKDDFVIVSMYTDDYAPLPASQVYTNKDGKLITTLADKSKDYELTKFHLLAMPLYMFLDLNGKPLSDELYQYDPSIQKFIQHLDEVKKKFENEK